MSGATLRKSFLSYFEKNGHFVAPSSPLVPQGDATLLFTNAGMVQFKDVFTGREKRPYQRAASSQKCVRAGGKHNDLENVGRTARHHTFFEMLGNFSFGDYFKEAAIHHAWTFLTRDLPIPAERLSVTVFEGDAQTPADVEAEELWKKIGVPASRISRHSAKDNFWQMGDTGPCGPCTEIHFERGAVKGAFGGDDPEGDRVLEIWNLVFMQFDRQADRSLIPLPAPSVDTGMGLERLAMVMNGCASNYDSDLLRPLISFSEEKLGKKYGSSDGAEDVAMRVIADHARTTAFLVADGVLPGNSTREYVLRSIMRRAIRFGEQLGFKDLFFHEPVLRVVELFGGHYGELRAAKSLLEKVVTTEEEAFRRTLKKGLDLYRSTVKASGKKLIGGAVVFDLKATHGFPPDLTAQMAREDGLDIDWDGFKKAEAAHAEVSAGELGTAGTADLYKQLKGEVGATVFLGYGAQEGAGRVVALLKDGKKVGALGQGERGLVLLDRTPFYGESGGQVGDSGELRSAGAVLKVADTKKEAELHLHQVEIVQGGVEVGQTVEARVDGERLERTRKNHSATHLLHWALRKVLGEHVTQKGSMVSPERLRFDFSHFEAMTSDELRKVEDIVNDMVLENVSADIAEMAIDDAKKKGAMALFGEKYGERVRVVAFPTTKGPSVELCGGIHVRRTGDIGLFRVTSEGPLAAGVRRLEAVTGKGALELVRKQSALLGDAARALKIGVDEVPARIEKLQESLRAAERELEKGRQKAQTQAAGDAVGAAVDVGGIKVLAQRLTDVDPKSLRDYADKLRDQLKSGVVVLGLPSGDDKVTLLVALTADLVGKLHAGKMIGELSAVVGGKGGGKPDFAQAGGSAPGKLDEAFKLAVELVRRAG
ncbi:MAG: alanine--tRNA ligase [Deltaproteobacteria bacterium]|nr:alanine--tRNA ligase [Deltaproteobacteria bacterium]